MDPVLGAAAIAAVASIINTFLQRRTQKKVNETHHQTTKNGHKNDPPTIPDLLSGLKADVQKLDARMSAHERWHRRN